MGDIIPRAQVVKLLEGDGFPAAVTVFEMEFVVAFKYLVIGVKRKVQLPVDKSFMQGNIQGGKVEILRLLAAMLEILKDRIDPFDLPWIIGKDEIVDALLRYFPPGWRSAGRNFY